MAYIGLSEFQYGFAFLYEQVSANWKDLDACPILPSLQKEANEGWDARLPIKGSPYFYQFKMTDYLTRRYARERIENSKSKNRVHSNPYFRFDLHPNNDYQQHKLLREKSKSERHVYYVVPAIIDKRGFDNIFLQKKIHLNSRLVPLSSCHKIKDFNAYHCITFEEHADFGYQHSDPQKINKIINTNTLEEFYKSSAKEWRLIDMDYLYQILKDLSPEISSKIYYRYENKFQILSQIYNILSTNFSATLVFVGEPRTIKK
jgi:hypothetical protein